MILKIEVDLKEFYNEGEEISFSESIKNHIAYEVKSLVYDEFKKLAIDEMTALVRKEFASTKTTQIEFIVSKIISESKIKKSDYGTELITLKEYLENSIKAEYFEPKKNAATVLNSWIKSFEEKFQLEVKAEAIRITKELKDRYDLLFASQVVAKMNESGMLDKNVAKLLLPES